MNKELEALLMLAAKATGRGVKGVDPVRAAEFGVELAELVREGQEWCGVKPTKAGYHTISGLNSLVIDQSSPGDGWTRYSVAELRPESTGHYRFGFAGVMTLAECKFYLRGVAEGAERKAS